MPGRRAQHAGRAAGDPLSVSDRDPCAARGQRRRRPVSRRPRRGARLPVPGAMPGQHQLRADEGSALGPPWRRGWARELRDHPPRRRRAGREGSQGNADPAAARRRRYLLYGRRRRLRRPRETCAGGDPVGSGGRARVEGGGAPRLRVRAMTDAAGRLAVSAAYRARIDDLRHAMEVAAVDQFLLYGNNWHADYLRYGSDFGIIEGQGLALFERDGAVTLLLDDPAEAERARAETPHEVVLARDLVGK